MPQSTDRHESPPELRTMFMILGALLVVAFWPFAIAELFWDDLLVIRPDGPIAHLSTIGAALFGRCVLFDPKYQYPYYRPLIDILFIIEYAIAGTAPFLYHLTNFVLHAANAAMLMLFVIRMLGRTEQSAFAALIGAGIFALHPIQCESVLWPAAPPAVLSLFFLLLGVHSFPSIIDSEKRGGLCALATVACFVSALLSKEIAIAAVPVALLLYGVRGARPPKLAVYTSIACTAVLVTYLVLNSAIGKSASHLGGGSIFATVVQAIPFLGFYIVKLIAPENLHPAYAGDLAKGWLYNVAGGAAIFATIIMFGAACILRTRTTLLAAAGLIFFCGSACLPLLASLTSLADRYVYQAMAGLGVAAAVAVHLLCQRKLPGRNATYGVAGGLAILALVTMHQSTYWIASESIWLHVTESDPQNYDANMYLGDIAEHRGDLQLAEKHYLIAMGTAPAIREDGAMAVGRVRMEADDPEGAIAAYELVPRDSPLVNDAKIREAVVEFSRGNVDKARAIIGSFEDSGAEPANVYTNLALLELRMNQDPKAASAWYQKARERGAPMNAELEAPQHN